MPCDRILTRAAATLLAALSCAACQGAVQSSSSPGVRADVNLPLTTRIVEAVVPVNATLETILTLQKVPGVMIVPVIEAVRSVFDPRRVRALQPYQVLWALDGRFVGFQYRVDPDRIPAEVTSIGTRLARDEELQVFLDRLEGLDAAEYDLIDLHAFQGLPWSEVASDLGLSADAARQRYSRLIAKLRAEGMPRCLDR